MWYPMRPSRSYGLVPGHLVRPGTAVSAGVDRRILACGGLTCESGIGARTYRSRVPVSARNSVWLAGTRTRGSKRSASSHRFSLAGVFLAVSRTA